MTTTNTTRPIVKTIDPDLYAQHTFHMKRAVRYTGKQKLAYIKRSLTIRLQKVEKQLEQCG